MASAHFGRLRNRSLLHFHSFDVDRARFGHINRADSLMAEGDPQRVRDIVVD
jgi:hypothetical protein